MACSRLERLECPDGVSGVPSVYGGAHGIWVGQGFSGTQGPDGVSGRHCDQTVLCSYTFLVLFVCLLQVLQIPFPIIALPPQAGHAGARARGAEERGTPARGGQDSVGFCVSAP